jgi:D-arabinose 1-dehydrogenase-like Zn-dependent alcohol dehydrogenase
MIGKRLTIKGWPSGHAKDSEETVAFAKFAGIKSQVEKYPLTKVSDALNDMINNKVRFRAVIVP